MLIHSKFFFRFPTALATALLLLFFANAQAADRPLGAYQEQEPMPMIYSWPVLRCTSLGNVVMRGTPRIAVGAHDGNV